MAAMYQPDGRPDHQAEILWPLRKSAVHLHLEYGHTFSNNMWGEHWSLRRGPPVELHLNLDRNLRKRNSDSASYDADQLCDYGMARLKLIQFSDEHLLKRLGHHSRWDGRTPQDWRLHITFRGQHQLWARPTWNGHSLLLSIVASASLGERQGDPAGE